MLFTNELTEEGYEVIKCAEGSRVMEIIEENRPDLIVLDIKLCEYNGLELLQEIRNTYYNLPVILCTAYPEFKNDLKSIAADFYVLKSSNLKELKLKIKMALEGEMESQSEETHSDVHETETTVMNQVKLPFKDNGSAI